MANNIKDPILSDSLSSSSSLSTQVNGDTYFNGFSNRYLYFDRLMNNPSKTIRVYQNNTLIIKFPLLIDDLEFSWENDWDDDGDNVFSKMIDKLGGMASGRGAKLTGEFLESFGYNIGSSGIQSFGNGIREFSNGKIRSLTSKIKSFNGTSFEFPSLEGSITLYSNNNNSVSLINYVSYIVNTLTGQDHDLSKELKVNGIPILNSLLDESYYQSAPHGYMFAINDTDEDNTLRMEIGELFSIDRLVCKQVKITFSKTRLSGTNSPYSVKINCNFDRSRYMPSSALNTILSSK